MNFGWGLGGGLAGVGLILFFASLACRLGDARQDVLLLKRWHLLLGRKPWVTFFRLLWPLGTTPVAIFGLVLLSIHDFRLGLIASAALGTATMIEMVIKRIHPRPRPYSALIEVQMLQPTSPRDPSFPSGDALRVWYMALVVPMVVVGGGPIWQWLLAVILIILAALISLGRLVFGVHYPSDVIAGAGLGLLATAGAIFLRMVILV